MKQETDSFLTGHHSFDTISLGNIHEKGKIMKKKSVVLVAVLLMMSFLLTACSSVSDEKWNTLSGKITQVVDLYNECKEAAKTAVGEDSDQYKAVFTEEAQKTMDDFAALKKDDFKNDEEVDQSIKMIDTYIGEMSASLDLFKSAEAAQDTEPEDAEAEDAEAEDAE